mmetsp:Transcript_23530/g.49788  ORF Transcript_23530/g.49788 Transcript_23530/m.49788 type:complete len:220 (-) Transcript_23530:149-808(-)
MFLSDPIGIPWSETRAIQNVLSLIASEDALHFHGSADLNGFLLLGFTIVVPFTSVLCFCDGRWRRNSILFDDVHPLLRERMRGNGTRGNHASIANAALQQFVHFLIATQCRQGFHGPIEQRMGLFSVQDSRHNTLTNNPLSEILHQDRGEGVQSGDVEAMQDAHVVGIAADALFGGTVPLDDFEGVQPGIDGAAEEDVVVQINMRPRGFVGVHGKDVSV